MKSFYLFVIAILSIAVMQGFAASDSGNGFHFGDLNKGRARASTTTTVGSRISSTTTTRRTTTTVGSTIGGRTTTTRAGQTTTTLRQTQGSAARDAVLRVLKLYSPTGYEIVHASETFPSSFRIGGFSIDMPNYGDFMKFYTGDIGGSINTMVHEMCHHYSSMETYVLNENNRDFDWNKHYICYYVGSETILVEFGDVFPSREMDRIAPAAIKVFRYDTYVSPSDPVQSTQIEGIFGLLDELNAYYQGTKAAYDMYEYYKTETPGKPADWLQYFSEIYGTHYAYLEFKLFILNYLLYAKQYKPDVYNAVIGNANFKKAYKIIDANWAQLITDIAKRKAEAFAFLRGEIGYTVSEANGYIMIQGTGRGVFTDEYNKLATELNRSVYAPVIAALR